MASQSCSVHRRSRRLSLSARRRAGSHTVEFALALPVLLLLITGAIEMTRMNMLRNTAQNAAYEGARRGALPGANANQAKAAAQTILDTVGTSNATITINPAVLTSTVSRVTVSVSIPLNDNGWITPYFTKDRSLLADCTLTRELVVN